MACKPDEDFEVISNEPAVDIAMTLLKTEDLLAVKCQSINLAELNRSLDIAIIMVATSKKAYVFDVRKLGKTVFTGGLQSILESTTQEKLMFDCRGQSDALWHQFQVKLDGVLDLQLLEVLYRREKSGNQKPSTKVRARRSHRPEEVECVYGYFHCMELYVKDVLFEGIKDEKEKKSLLRLLMAIRKSPPLSNKGLENAIIKEIRLKHIIGMFSLYEKMKEILTDEERNRILVASERYVNFYRNREKRKFNGYEANTYKDINIKQFKLLEIDPLRFSSSDGFTDGYLPLDIIPEKGTHIPLKATHTCTTCERKFPRQEFSNTQLRNDDQKCRVCKEIKRRDDVESNRNDNYERNEERTRFRWQMRNYYHDSYDDSVVYEDEFPPCGNDHCYHYGCSCEDGDEYY